jgi:cell division protein FtsQ
MRVSLRERKKFRSFRNPLDIRLMQLVTRWLLLIFTGAALAGTVHWVTHLPLFDIQNITISGEVQHHNEASLRAHIAPHLKGTLFTIDLGDVKNVFQNVPWVRNAVVRREFPNTLKVVLQEHRAAAYWGSDNAQRLINNYGEVFDANTGEVEEETLPHLNGPEGRGLDVLNMYYAISPYFNRAKIPIDELELNPGGGWRAMVETGAIVEIGHGDLNQILSKVQQFTDTIPHVTARYTRQMAALEYADLRHQNGYAIRLSGITTAVDASKK